MYAYVGCRTTRERNARGEGIGVFDVEAETGRLTFVQLLDGMVNPSYLALGPTGDRLYSVHGDTTEASAFAVDASTGKLELLNVAETGGRNPVHLALDAQGRHLVVTNHIGASLTVLPIAADGSLSPRTQLVSVDGPVGPHRIEQSQPKPHFNQFDPAGKFVIVPDKGTNRIFSFQYDHGQLRPANPGFVATRETAGPRHITFGTDGRYAYCVNELDSTVTTYAYDANTGVLSARQILSATPETYTGDSRAAAIVTHPSGRFIYASNRGDDSSAIFHVDRDTGLLARHAAVPTLGRTPRAISLSPDGRLMYALNEDSDTIVSFFVDDTTGDLSPTGHSLHWKSPVCMIFSA